MAVLRGAFGLFVGDQLLAFPLALLFASFGIGVAKMDGMTNLYRFALGIVVAVLMMVDYMRRESGQKPLAWPMFGIILLVPILFAFV